MSYDRFDEIISHVLTNEGGYVDHPSDPGGATNYGISLRFLQDVDLSYADIDGDGDVDKDDIKALTLEQAKVIYRVMWWDRYGYENISDGTVAAKVLDMSINMGAKRAHILTQRAVNAVAGANLATDGILGSMTFEAINAVADTQELLYAIMNEQKQFYTNLISQKPSLAAFRRGWERRAEALTSANMIA